MRSILLLLFSVLSLQLSAQSWKHYPYQPEGTALTFPADEGHHPGEPVEWWYTIGHVTGDSSGTPYSYMLTYFYYPTLGFDGFRILNFANDQTGQFFVETQAANYSTMAEDHLEIDAQILLGSNESWVTKQDSTGALIPFEYHVQATQANGSLDMDYAALKRPLILDTTGYFNQGATSYTYYYSQSLLEAHGSLTFDGLTEQVTGTAWIDRQWGNFNPSTGEQYEWFCVQLDNGMDFNIWNVFDTEGDIPDTSTYRLTSIYVNDSIDMNTHDFTFHRTAYAYLPDSSRIYSAQWHFVYGNIDLMITTLHNNSEVQLPFRFYEGTTTIAGTVGGVPVTGVGFAELLHPYEVPQMQLTHPTEGGGWIGTETIAWDLLNPDGGREVYYDLEYSIDNKVSYSPIASNLSQTSYEWDGDGTAFGTDCWIKVTGYSFDHTIIGQYEMQNPFTFGFVGLDELVSDALHVLIYPNPTSDGTVNIQFDKNTDIASIALCSISGRVLIQKELTADRPKGRSLKLDVSDLPNGIYLVRMVFADRTQAVRKLFLTE